MRIAAGVALVSVIGAIFALPRHRGPAIAEMPWLADAALLPAA